MRQWADNDGGGTLQLPGIRTQHGGRIVRYIYIPSAHNMPALVVPVLQFLICFAFAGKMVCGQS